jgi:hypothetical protein
MTVGIGELRKQAIGGVPSRPILAILIVAFQRVSRY